MKTIYKPDDGPVTIAEAKRLIFEALPDGTAAEVWMHEDADGNPLWDGPMELKELPEANLYDLDGVILDMHQQGQITPRFRFRPTQTDYTGRSDDLYEIGHSEFVTVAQMFSCRVCVGDAPAATPVSKEQSPAERRVQRLAMFEEKGGERKRGALAELARELNVDRANLAKDLKKAREEKAKKHREGVLSATIGQLVKGGKR